MKQHQCLIMMKVGLWVENSFLFARHTPKIRPKKFYIFEISNFKL